MTFPSGSISSGVSVDANHLPTEITRAVQSAMGDVLRNVRSGMGQVEGAFNNIDTSGFSDIAVPPVKPRRKGSVLRNAPRNPGVRVVRWRRTRSVPPAR